MGCTSSVPSVEEEINPPVVVKEVIPPAVLKEINPPVVVKEVIPVVEEDVNNVNQSAYGYITKQGQKNKLSWKSRFFTLDNGILTYYESALKNSSVGIKELGKINLSGYNLTSKGDYITLTKPNARELVLMIENTAVRQMWVNVILNNIKQV